MNKYIINGGRALSGELTVQGAKNSVLPLLAATLICETPSVLFNCPDIRDVRATFNILRHLGCAIRYDAGRAEIDACGSSNKKVPDTMMREMRSSVILLGAMLGRFGEAQVSFPGGCELGPRPIDLHLAAFKKLGVQIEEQYGGIYCKVKRLAGANIHLSFPSVGATENIMLLASIASGVTTIQNAAKEPEIEDLQNFLNCCGAKISGAGSDTIIIRGVKKLYGCEYSIIPDRIVASTYMAAAAITGGNILLRGCKPDHLGAVLSVFEQSGCKIHTEHDLIYLSRKNTIQAVPTIRSLPYPGFPTDGVAQMMAYLTVAKGSSIFVENIFQSRYKHVAELSRMGANIKVQGSVAIVEGVGGLYGAEVESTDLRGGAALVVAALSAQSESRIGKVEYIERGYDDICGVLVSLGADIVKIEE